jgi:hypothetical protein
MASTFLHSFNVPFFKHPIKESTLPPFALVLACGPRLTMV